MGFGIPPIWFNPPSGGSGGTGGGPVGGMPPTGGTGGGSGGMGGGGFGGGAGGSGCGVGGGNGGYGSGFNPNSSICNFQGANPVGGTCCTNSYTPNAADYDGSPVPCLTKP